MTGTELIALLKKYPVSVTCWILSLLCGGALYWRWDVLDETRQKVEELSKQRDAMNSNVRNSAGLAHQVELLQQATKQME